MQLREEVQGPEDKLNSDSNDQLNEKVLKPSSCGLTFLLKSKMRWHLIKLSWGKRSKKDDKKYDLRKN